MQRPSLAHLCNIYWMPLWGKHFFFFFWIFKIQVEFLVPTRCFIKFIWRKKKKIIFAPFKLHSGSCMFSQFIFFFLEIPFNHVSQCITFYFCSCFLEFILGKVKHKQKIISTGLFKRVNNFCKYVLRATICTEVTKAQKRPYSSRFCFS